MVVDLNPRALLSDMVYPDINYSGQTLSAWKVPAERFGGKIETFGSDSLQQMSHVCEVLQFQAKKRHFLKIIAFYAQYAQTRSWSLGTEN